VWFSRLSAFPLALLLVAPPAAANDHAPGPAALASWPDPADEPAGLTQIRPDTVDWGGVTVDSLKFLALQHGARLVIRAHVREGLKGPFFKDYWETLREPPAGFTDGDPWFTNIVGHSIQGSTAYLIARANGGTRTQAFWWGVIYSTQFEVGPLGEAAIGNIRTSPIDLVVTPLAGFALGVAEEWLLERLPRRGERFWLLTRPLVMGHVFLRLTTGK
jgi:hypothetical protein